MSLLTLISSRLTSQSQLFLQPFGIAAARQVAGARRPLQTALAGLVLVLTAVAGPASVGVAKPDGYILGPEDSLSIRVVNADEVGPAPYAIDLRGNISLPRVGRIVAAGRTLEDLQAELTGRFGEYLQQPMVTVSIADYRSQPISVLGAVASPGVHQIRGRKTLVEVVSEAGGLKATAGNSIKITRRNDSGSLPLANAVADSSGEFTVGEVNIRSLMQAENPRDNIAVRPNDVITVPVAALVYVVGAVKRSGGFILTEKSSMSVLEALSMAEGFDHAASPAKARILRADPSGSRTEVPVDLKSILAGKHTDLALGANDILFIPTNAAKSVSMRALEAVVQVGTGVAIYR